MRIAPTLLVLCLLPMGATAQPRLPSAADLIVNEDRSLVQSRQTVRISAGQLWDTAEIAGATLGRTVSAPQFPPSCNAWTQGHGSASEIYAEYIVPPSLSAVFAPPRIDPEPFRCSLRILNITLDGGWQLDALEDTASDCTPGATFSVTRRSGNLTDMTHQIEIRLPSDSSSGGYCTLTIGTAVMTGPLGQTWNNGFN